MIMNNFRRAGDQEDLIITEEIILDDTTLAKEYGGFEQNPNKKIINPELKSLFQNITTNPTYHKENVEKINDANITKGDIVEIIFNKDFQEKNKKVILRFYIKTKYSTSIIGYIYVIDEETGFDSKARGEKLALPIIAGGKRKIALKESLNEAIFISLQTFLHEKRIQEINIYKKGAQVKGLIGSIKDKLGSLLGK